MDPRADAEHDDDDQRDEEKETHVGV